MFIVAMLLPSDDIPNEVETTHETFEAALKDADRLFAHYGGARRLEIYETMEAYQAIKSNRYLRLIASLRIIR
jgi:hypothetical protein